MPRRSSVRFAPIGFNWQISIALVPGLAAFVTYRVTLLFTGAA